MNTSSPPTPCCMNRAYHGCPVGPDGQTKTECTECHGSGTEMTAPPGHQHEDDLAEYAPCSFCGGNREITVQGTLEFQPELAKERKARGWRIAS